MYENMCDDSLLMVAFTGRTEQPRLDDAVDTNDFFKGRCFLKHKCVEMEQLDVEVKELYGLVNKNKEINGSASLEKHQSDNDE